jgi:hypothetical protein
MYNPDPRILKYLREYDSDLGARWDGEIQRWQLTWRDKDVMILQNVDGSYRPLDERAITKAIVGDAWRHKSGADFLRVLESHRHRIDAADRAKMQDDYMQMMKSDGYRAVFGGPQITGWSGA